MQLKDGELLAALIKARKYSLRGFADEAMGWRSHTYLQRLIRGEVRTVKPDTAVLMAHRLGVDLDVLFDTRVSTITVRNDDENRPRKTA